MMSANSNPIIKPVIRGSQIVAVEINGLELRLDRPANISELQEIVTAIEGFCKYFRLEELSDVSIARRGQVFEEFEPEELIEFLKELKPDQILALKILAEAGKDGIPRKEFVSRMRELLDDPKFSGWALGGKLAGISIRAHKGWGKESIFERCHIRRGDEIVSGWRLKEKYLPIVRGWFQEMGETL